MKFFCIGEREFCEFYSFICAEYSLCTDNRRAAGIISSRSDEEIILISSRLLDRMPHELDTLIHDAKKRIVPLPSPDGKIGSEEPAVILKDVIGGA